MARPKEFERDVALQKAITVFSRHGYEGTPTDALLSGMGIRRQSMYDTFGDKWQLYIEALRAYGNANVSAQIGVLEAAENARTAIKALLEHMVKVATSDPSVGCMGVNAVCEFGRERPDVSELGEASHRRLLAAIERHISAGRSSGELSVDIDPAEAAEFVIATLTSLRVAARGGAPAEKLAGIVRMAMRSLT